MEPSITDLMAIQFAKGAMEEKVTGSTDPLWDYYIALGKAAELKMEAPCRAKQP